jgi:hypothetical protein
MSPIYPEGLSDTAAAELRKAWGGKPCNHPGFEREKSIMGTPRSSDMWDYATGDYVCHVCGQVFTHDERMQIEANREEKP